MNQNNQFNLQNLNQINTSNPQNLILPQKSVYSQDNAMTINNSAASVRFNENNLVRKNEVAKQGGYSGNNNEIYYQNYERSVLFIRKYSWKLLSAK